MSARALSALVVLFVALPILADEPSFDFASPKGKPKDYKLGATARFAIWNDAAGWHIRNTTASKEQTAFTGTIETVGGKISTMSLISKGKASPPLKANTAKFSIKDNINKGLEGGMDLKLDNDVTAIKFDLQINGKASPELIYIGAKDEHPQEAAFALAAKPGKK